MLNEFKNWLLNRNYKPSTAEDYQGRIERLCRKEAITLDFLAKNFDELIRIPDYISGAVASMDFEDVYKVSEKHYNLFDKSIVDNERIYIMHLKHNQNNDTLSNLIFTRI